MTVRPDTWDDAREVGGGDVELVGIEAYVVVLHEVMREQADEVDEEVGGAFACLFVADGEFHDVAEVEHEQGVEGAQTFFQEAMTGALVINDFLHPFAQMRCLCLAEVYHGLSQFGDGKVGCADDVPNGGCFEGDVLVGHEAQGMVVLRPAENRYLKAR